MGLQIECTAAFVYLFWFLFQEITYSALRVICSGKGPKTLSIIAKCSKFSCVWNKASPWKHYVSLYKYIVRDYLNSNKRSKRSNRAEFNKYATNTPHITWVTPSKTCIESANKDPNILSATSSIQKAKIPNISTSLASLIIYESFKVIWNCIFILNELIQWAKRSHCSQVSYR